MCSWLQACAWRPQPVGELHSPTPRPLSLCALQVAGLQQLHKLSLPFPITSSHLQRLCKLPALEELLSFNQLELDVLGPAHDPLAHVSKLVASSIDSHGKPLASVFPALQSVYLRSCGDMEALSLRSCGGGLQQLVAGDCSALTDEGFAGLRVLRGLNRLQVDNAHQVRGPWGSCLWLCVHRGGGPTGRIGM